MKPSYTIVTPYSEMAAYIDRTDMKHIFSECVVAMEAEQKRGKTKRVFGTKPGPGRMTRTPRADTGDSVGHPGDSIG